MRGTKAVWVKARSSTNHLVTGASQQKDAMGALFKVLLLTWAAGIWTPATGRGLYTENDPTALLDENNFNTTVFRSPSAWLVEFYMDWCGHCQRFAATWNALGRTVQDWSSVIKIGAVNCAEAINRALCQRNGVIFVPTLKFFQQDASASDNSPYYDGKEEASLIRSAMLKFLISHPNASNIWPFLFPLQSPVDVLTEGSTGGYLKAVIVEANENDTLAMEVILSMLPDRRVTVRRLVGGRDVTEFPSMYQVLQNGRQRLLLSGKNDTGSYISLLKQVAGETIASTTPRPTTERVTTISSKETRPRVYMQDLESGLHFAFTQEVPLHSSLKDGDLENLKAFIDVLAKYFPGRPQVHLYLQRLNNWLQGQSMVSVDQWLNQLSKLQSREASLPDTTKWVGCKGSADNYRGYPCSLWTLFHTLTVNAAAVNKYNSNWEPAEVLVAMNGYIQSFFSCHECAENFGLMAAGITTGETNKAYGIMWLWEAHNKANKRLHEDITEDPAFPKIQFPSYSACPSCHMTIPATNQDKPVWNRPGVLRFLQKMYGKENIVQDTVPVASTSRAQTKTTNPLMYMFIFVH
ncbi:sulfhydryl oxidase 1 [Lingula anatina]|uniref:Sulfhydryl oxidase n=1 Tax=Lingula anatina TaxID=7574 RepID=A0A1S3JGU2_LINAN|nr:sulfhydryl oxidase 1 [Lingula anatina]|eukprot:XP_013409366.1 sulfhydryl oxidase 1 [Lingula anatina]